MSYLLSSSADLEPALTYTRNMRRRVWCKASEEELMWSARWELALALHLGAWPLWSSVAEHLQRDVASDEDLRYDWIYDGVQWDAKSTVERTGPGSQLVLRKKRDSVFYALGEHGEGQSPGGTEVLFYYVGGIAGDDGRWTRYDRTWVCPREAFLGRYRPDHGIHPPTV